MNRITQYKILGKSDHKIEHDEADFFQNQKNMEF